MFFIQLVVHLWKSIRFNFILDTLIKILPEYISNHKCCCQCSLITCVNRWPHHTQLRDILREKICVYTKWFNTSSFYIFVPLFFSFVCLCCCHFLLLSRNYLWTLLFLFLFVILIWGAKVVLNWSPERLSWIVWPLRYLFLVTPRLLFFSPSKGLG